MQTQLTSANETIKSQTASIESERVRVEQLVADNAQFVAHGTNFIASSDCAIFTNTEIHLATAERTELRANIASLESQIAEKLAAIKTSVSCK